ncbi:FAD/NAD(P)-binding domain-containing protein [Pseudovirgaria hyperparasitica]|uniref:FAD/NAD(P)-binding domain-containing protein n=1 Tax=Pseudovirgaria hyperparasitica TaxID=470096 RepID=A0A6A6WHL2_9PEZI|nr:FAD/NAD(P)-binding domain-containing protein [Pseudovirgaria hyperparasitica]KAF2762292.1 FAD/NAD(P)-binding domain-containing protein [Pseudovirgaria hyperparasitica]
MSVAPRPAFAEVVRVSERLKTPHLDSNGNTVQPDTPNGGLSYHLCDAPVENFRPVKVLVIGAGYSGILCGIRIPERIRNVDVAIYDKNSGIGGAWYENRYPGCACDVPSHSYQYSFEPNPEWTSLYAPANEIRQYLTRTAKKYGVDRFIKLNHKVTRCRYNGDTGKWHLTIVNLLSGQISEDVGDILISGRGNLNSISWPKIKGLETFKGELMHSASWNVNYDFTAKRIGVIGSGSSAIQIIPQLQKVPGARLSCFIRSPTWISPPFGQQLWDTLGMKGTEIPEELRETLKMDPAEYLKFRLRIEEYGNSIHGSTFRGSPQQTASQADFEAYMKSKLADRPDILNTLRPSFSPGCRRLTPGPGFLEALTEPNVQVIKDEIREIEFNGIRTADGTLHRMDALVCATGFDTGAAPPFPVEGEGGTLLQAKWKDRPTNYLSVAVDEFPNHFMMLGPNAAIGSGSLTMMIEGANDYIVKCIRKIQKENIKSMVVKAARVRDFTAYVDAYFEKTVYTEECRSWYKKNGKVVGLWPGSTLHCLESLRSPRWEDFEYEYIGESRGVEVNRMAWLGNGWSERQLEKKDLAWYLYPEFQEVPAPGKPEESERYRIRPFSH